MDLVEVVRIIRTRWYVLIPLLLLTAALAVGVDKKVPTKYQATSSITLLASQSATSGTSTVPGTGNAFASFNSALNDTADFLVRRMGSADVANDLASRGVTESYAVALAAAAQGPFITLTVTGSNPQHVLTSMNTLQLYTQQELQTVQEQASVKPVDMIRSMIMVPAGPPSKQTKTKTQDVLGAAIGGLVVTFLAVFVVENVATSRKRRRRRVPFGAGADDDPEGTAGSGGVDGEPHAAASSVEPAADGEWYPDGVDAGVRGAGSGVGTNGGAGAGGVGSGAVNGGGDRDPFEPARPELSGRAPTSARE
jgi:capsular polysaccharide biosynthesis protein